MRRDRKRIGRDDQRSSRLSGAREPPSTLPMPLRLNRSIEPGRSAVGDIRAALDASSFVEILRAPGRCITGPNFDDHAADLMIRQLPTLSGRRSAVRYGLACSKRIAPRSLPEGLEHGMFGNAGHELAGLKEAVKRCQ